MKQKNIPTGNSGHGRVPEENMEATVKAKDSYSTAEMHIMSLETEGCFLSISDIIVTNVRVSIYENGFEGSSEPEPDVIIFE